MICFAPSSVVAVDAAGEGLRHALPDEHQRADDAERQQHVERDAHQIGPEIADGLRRPPREAAHDGDGDRDAGGGRQEVLHGEAEHLRQMAHRRLAAVELPVGVGQEADRGVEGEVGRDRPLAGGIERQHGLQPQDRVEQQEARRLEDQHGDRVGQPGLLLRRVDAGEAIQAALDRAEHGGEQGALALDDAQRG